MAVRADLSRRSAWGSGVQGGPSSRIREINEAPPGHSGVSILCEMFDGDNAPWNGLPGQVNAEVAQVQCGHVFPYGQARWISFWMNYETVANYSSRDWHFCAETHFSAGGTSAPWAVNLQGQTHQFVFTPSGWNRQYPSATFRPVRAGEWFRMTIGHLPHTSNGWFEVYYGDQKVWEVRNVRTSDRAESSYMKIGWYRPQGVSGRDAVKFYDMKVYDALPDLTGSGGEPTPDPDPDPDPTPGDTTGPNVTIVKPTSGQEFVDKVVWEVTADDTSGVDRVEVFLHMTSDFRIGTDTTLPYSGEYTVTNWQRGDYTLKARVYDKAGNMTEKTLPFKLVAATPPPPDPDPDPEPGEVDLEALKTDLEAIKSFAESRKNYFAGRSANEEGLFINDKATVVDQWTTVMNRAMLAFERFNV
jgi:hypothetical protein